jgi:hypothetical protein
MRGEMRWCGRALVHVGGDLAFKGLRRSGEGIAVNLDLEGAVGQAKHLRNGVAGHDRTVGEFRLISNGAPRERPSDKHRQQEPRLHR